LLNYDLGRIVLIVLLLGITSYNLFLGLLLLFVVVFLYENNNISKYNMDGNKEFKSSTKKNITVNDILNLENNISSKQSNNRMGLGFIHETSNSNINIQPSYEGLFNNFASAYQ
jgi:hypothetical protein